MVSDYFMFINKTVYGFRLFFSPSIIFRLESPCMLGVQPLVILIEVMFFWSAEILPTTGQRKLHNHIDPEMVIC